MPALVLSPVDTDSDRACEELLTYLADEPGLRASQQALAAGHEPVKGVATEIAVALSGSGMIAGTVRVIQLWLSRDRDRRLRLTVRTGETSTEVELTGEDVSDATVRAVLEKLLAPPQEEKPAEPEAG